MEDPIRFYTSLITNIATLPTLVVMLYQLAKKYRASKDPETGKADTVRLLVLLQIAFWFESIMYPILNNIIFQHETRNIFQSLNVSSLSIAFMITTGITLLAYVHHKESWMFAGWFFYGGILLYSIFTGVVFTFFTFENRFMLGDLDYSGNADTFFALQFGFTLVGQTSVVLFFFLTGRKYKDDKIFGLALFFLMPVIAGMMASNLIVYVICYGFVAVYGIPYAMGKIRFFKPAPVKLVEVEACT
ncbi:MAG: hypothetical protein JW839_22175 [Candidatus Lokiarchaeota archaeon]|nr:hypothetical protein [Candidatus Lokiarchaeota archaeon]